MFIQIKQKHTTDQLGLLVESHHLHVIQVVDQHLVVLTLYFLVVFLHQAYQGKLLQKVTTEQHGQQDLLYQQVVCKWDLVDLLQQLHYLLVVIMEREALIQTQ